MHKKLTFLFFCFSLVFWAQSAAANPYVFVENKGQWRSEVQYKMNLPAGALFVENNAFTFAFRDAQLLRDIHDQKRGFSTETKWNHHAYKMQFIGASINTIIESTEGTAARYNYFLGNDETKWASDARGFKNLALKEIYPGIDAHFYGKGENLKYDLVVKPNSNPNRILIKYQGLDSLLLQNGKLQFYTSVNQITENTPVAYQFIKGEYKEVACQFVLTENAVSFQIGTYDTSKTLIIDPDLIFSTFSGSVSDNFGNTATFDRFGNLYSGSTAFGVNYPTTLGAYSVQFSGGNADIAISKFNATGTTLLYSTFVGGSSDELPHSLVVDDNGSLYALATTSSLNFPTPNGFDQSFNGGTSLLLGGLGVSFINGTDIAAFRLSASGGQLLGGTYLGGSANDGLNLNADLRYNYADEVRGEILLDRNGDVLIASSTLSNNFLLLNPGLSGSFLGGTQDGVILKMNPNFTQMIWGSYFGGNEADAIYSIAVDEDNEIYLAGGTRSTNFNALSFPFFSTYQGGRADAMIAKINSAGNQILASTYFGTSAYDQVYFIETDESENIYVYGQTEINGTPFQITSTFGQVNAGQFVTKFNPALSGVIWSSQFGVNTPPTQNASPNLSPTAFLVDICNNVYLAGWGGTTNQPNPFNGLSNNTSNTVGLPLTADALQDTTDGSDFYLLVIRDDGNAPIYGSYFGGPQSSEHVDGGTSRFDKTGKIYQAVCAGCGGFSDLFTTPNAYADSNASAGGGQCNLAVFKYDFNLPLVNANFNLEESGCAPFIPTIQNLSNPHTATQYSWSLGNTNFSTDTTPQLTFTQKGTYQIRLVVEDTNSCNLADTTFQTVVIDEDSVFQLQPIQACLFDTVVLGFQPLANEFYTWLNPQNVIDTNGSLAQIMAVEGNNYTLIIEEEICVDTAFQELNVDSFFVQLNADTTLCGPIDSFLIELTEIGSLSNFYLSSFSDFRDTLFQSNQPVAVPVFPSSAFNQYFLLAQNANGCTNRASFNLSLNLFAYRPMPDTTVCRGDTILYALQPLYAAANQIQWSANNAVLAGGNTENPLILPSEGLTLSYLAQDTNGCTATDTLSFSLDSIVLNSINDTLVCAPLASLQIPSVITNGNGSIYLSSNSSFTDTLAQTTDSLLLFQNPSLSGDFWLRAVNSIGCTDEDTFRLSLSFFDAQTTPEIRICRGDSVLLIAQATRGQIDSIQWYNTTSIMGASNRDSVLAAPMQQEQFFFEALNTDGCLERDTVEVLVSQIAMDSIALQTSADSVLAGEIVGFDAFPPGYAYQWISSTAGLLNDTSMSISQEIEEDTRIELRVFDTLLNRCSVVRTATVRVFEVNCEEPFLFIPNAFSPNGDGNNDVFSIRGNYIDEAYLNVYNRWGELLFESNGNRNGWDGTVNNTALDPDVFVYTARVVCVDGQVFEKQGNVTLLR